MSRNKGTMLVKAFERAVRQHEMKGAFPPGDWDVIQHSYDFTKERLLAYVNEAEKKLNKPVN